MHAIYFLLSGFIVYKGRIMGYWEQIEEEIRHINWNLVGTKWEHCGNSKIHKKKPQNSPAPLTPQEKNWALLST
jgi:hypothetical protein